jgi:hypothetical protein
MDRHDDLPRRFLELASAWTPARRRDWSRAMLAELDQITGTATRWRFALGAARVALIPPASGRPAALVLAVLGGVAAVIIHVKLPTDGLLTAIVIPGLPAAGAWLAVARPHPSRRVSAIGGAVQVIAVAAIVACPVLALRESVLYPGNGGSSMPYAGDAITVIFAAELAAYLLLILRRPAPLGSGRHSGLLGLTAATITGVVFLLSQPSGGQSDNPVVAMAVQATAIGAPIAAGLLAAGIELRRPRAAIRPWVGICEMLWGALLTGPAAFIVCLLTTSNTSVVAEARQPATILEAHQQGATSVTAWVAADDLGGAMCTTFKGLTFISMLIFICAYTMHRWGARTEPPSADGRDDVVAVGG